MKVRTRIAPSPTGFPHLGTVYNALINYVFAKQFDGDFIVRIEDTDRNRFVEGSEEVIFNSLKWFGIEPDEDPIKGGKYAPYRQSEKLGTYKKYAEELVEKDHAYFCFCSKERLEELRKEQEKNHQPPMYDKKCLNLTKEEVDERLNKGESHVIRLKVPKDRKILVKDVVVGEVEFDSNLIDDQVLLKADGFPTYHLGVVVDDHLMEITHIIRGSEWLPSTPKHVLLYEYFGWEMPPLIQTPLILNSEGQGKLSKRHGHASVDFYKKEGYLPEAVLNYLVNIIWNHPEGKEIYDYKEFGKAFNLDPLKADLKPQGAKFDLKKLDWVNGEYIRKMTDEELAKRLEQYLSEISEGQVHPATAKLKELAPLVKERIKKLSDFIPLTDFLFEEPEYEKEVFTKTVKYKDIKALLGKVSDVFSGLKSPWQKEDFEETFKKFAQENNLSTTESFQLIRIAISGQTVTPPLFESIEILGEDETKERIRQALSNF